METLLERVVRNTHLYDRRQGERLSFGKNFIETDVSGVIGVEIFEGFDMRLMIYSSETNALPSVFLAAASGLWRVEIEGRRNDACDRNVLGCEQPRRSKPCLVPA